MSQPESSDTHFFNSFSVVLGILIAFTICLFAFARGLGRDYQLRDVRDDPLLKQQVAQNTAPFAREAVAGQDNSALAITPTARGRCIGLGGGRPHHRRGGVQAGVLRLSRHRSQRRTQGRR